MKKALFLSVLSSFLFAFTFIINRSMNLGGGYWLWNSPLRYLSTLPMMAAIVALRSIKTWKSARKGIDLVIDAIKENPLEWVLWSTVGFGLFYLPLTLGSVYGESWLTASCWEITIVVGVLLTPLFGKKIPIRNLLLSGIIVIGVFVIQIPNMTTNNMMTNVYAFIPILVAAFSYPLGNRKMMQICPSELDTMQRILGMLICSTPFWIIVAIIAAITGGAPTGGQIVQSIAVAIFSGIIATTLFFRATDIVKNNPKQLAVIEAAQCGEVIFTLLGGVVLLHDAIPTTFGVVGMLLIIIGMVVNSLCT